MDSGDEREEERGKPGPEEEEDEDESFATCGSDVSYNRNDNNSSNMSPSTQRSRTSKTRSPLPEKSQQQEHQHQQLQVQQKRQEQQQNQEQQQQQQLNQQQEQEQQKRQERQGQREENISGVKNNFDEAEVKAERLADDAWDNSDVKTEVDVSDIEEEEEELADIPDMESLAENLGIEICQLKSGETPTIVSRYLSRLEREKSETESEDESFEAFRAMRMRTDREATAPERDITEDDTETAEFQTKLRQVSTSKTLFLLLCRWQTGKISWTVCPWQAFFSK
jgi:hypothetical protein